MPLPKPCLPEEFQKKYLSVVPVSTDDHNDCHQPPFCSLVSASLDCGFFGNRTYMTPTEAILAANQERSRGSI